MTTLFLDWKDELLALWVTRITVNNKGFSETYGLKQGFSSVAHALPGKHEVVSLIPVPKKNLLKKKKT